MEETDAHIYRVTQRDGSFEVTTDSGSVILTCVDESTARNYAVLLTEAFRRGYKLGYRDGKKNGPGAKTV